jgi:hypothetical protein
MNEYVPGELIMPKPSKTSFLTCIIKAVIRTSTQLSREAACIGSFLSYYYFYWMIYLSVVVVAFQSIFHVEMHQNDIFFKKKSFLRSAHKNNQKHVKKNYFLAKKKKLNFFGNTGATAFPNTHVHVNPCPAVITL